MRIVGQIAHPIFKITIFQTTQKYALKVEDRFFEQWYKFRSDELPDGLKSIHNFVTPGFLDKTAGLFLKMMENKREQMKAIYTDQQNQV